MKEKLSCVAIIKAAVNIITLNVIFALASQFKASAHEGCRLLSSHMIVSCRL